MLKKDEMSIEILEDGTIRIEAVGAISAPNHMQAEQLLRNVHDMTGGNVRVEHKNHARNPAKIRQHVEQRN